MISLQKAAWMASHPVASIRELRTVYKVSRCAPVFEDKPWMEPEDIATLEALCGPSRAVVEYGAGSSTLFYARISHSIHSVDSSRDYVAAVLEEAKRRDLQNVYVTPVDLGPITWWGWPIDQYPTARNLERWQRYLQGPWAGLEDTPVGLVIVDGRFRAACAGYALARLAERGEKDSTVFIDDYVGREDTYSRIGEIADIQLTSGRGAIVRLRGTDPAPADAFASRAITDLS